jgi:iron complex transport system permease protein
MRNRQRLSAWLLPFLTLLAAALHLRTGTYALSYGEIAAALGGAEGPAAFAVRELRLPRLLLALFTGANLALGGYYMQALVRNPLADPYVMGLTAGAGLGVNMLILKVLPLAAAWLFPFFAGAGALLSLLLVLALGFRALESDSARLLIAGVAVGSLCTALTGLLIYARAEDDQLRQILFWSFGSFDRAGWAGVEVSGALLLLSLAGGWLLGPSLDVLSLGDAQARSLGLDTARMRVGVLLLSSLTVGGNIAFTGPVGFVGMMIPHFSRSLLGASHRPALPLAALMGGGFLCLCDALGRQLLPPAGLPIGIITALLGAPFFLYVLYSRRSQL